MLERYRVLDLADDRGLLCGQILADLGAEVIAIEPPGGNRARRLGPYAGGAPDPERSLTWWAYARGKRSVVLDLETEEGREALREMARASDFLVESFAPGRMASLGLGYDDLAAVNPSLVYVSITPFGQDGPKSGYAATDIVVSAASGVMGMIGDEDRPPVRFSLPQAFLHAGALGADGALIAHHERLRSGRGQHVDVSAQVAFARATQSNILNAAVGDTDPQRVRGGVVFGGLPIRLVWPAKDGFISLTFLFGSSIGPFSRRLMEWVCEEGACDEATRDKDWIGYTGLLLSGKEPIEEYQRVLGILGQFIASKTKADLLGVALERRLLIAPMTTTSELAASEQFEARNYWREIESPRTDRAVRYPGPFARFQRSPIENAHPAPTLGEHQDVAPARPREAPSAAGAGDALPLDGLKIVDLMWVMAGPQATRILADYGATVIKVESTTRVDTARGLAPHYNGRLSADSGLFQNMNAGKRGVVLDLGTEEGRAIFVDMVRWADVVTEAFTPGTMQDWGLDYESLKQINPRLIMLSTCLFGQDGPMSKLSGFGTMGAAVAGFNSIIGWPDREPAMVGAYTDYVAPYYTVAALLAALDERERSGEGQYIDFSQAESALHFLAPALLDYAVNEHELGRRGNRDSEMAPHGAYPVAGDDRWIAIAARDDRDWGALCELIGRPDLAGDDRYATVAARLERAEELDEIVAAWTRRQDGKAAELRLQQAGVPAHTVDKSSVLVDDPQLRHRGHFVKLPHPVHGTAVVEGPLVRLSRTPGRVERAAPTFGQDNYEVLTGILGYADDRVAQLAAAEIFR